MEECHAVMGLWGQQNSVPVIVSDCIVQLYEDDDNDTNLIQGIRQRVELVKMKNIQAWLEENPTSAVTNSTSPDGRVVRHNIWGASFVAASDGSKQVKLATLSQDFEDILHAMDLKSDRAQMFAESLANFLEE
eukprot:2427322-Ditylum_brightwellii.AAC.1